MQFIGVLVAVFATHMAAAQNTTFLQSPVFLWDAPVAPVGEGNECAMAPTAFNPLLVCSSTEGIVTALQADSSSPWKYVPDTGGTTTSTSGITFNANGTFFVYGTTTDTGGDFPIWYVCVLKWSVNDLLLSCPL